MRVVVVGVFSTSMLTFRGEMLRAMAHNGHTVLALAPEDDDAVAEALAALGVEYRSVPMDRTGMNPVRDALTVRALVRIFRDFRADAVLVYAAKPVIFGSIAARLAGVDRRAAMITGVGSALGGGSGWRRRVLSSLMRLLYAVGLRQSQVVFFQNPDDQRLFGALGLLGKGTRAVRINGSGVDLTRFAMEPMPTGPITFLMMSRLIRDKGVYEYVEAARQVRRVYPEARFRLLGMLDTNPSAISQGELDAWQESGDIEYLGTTEDVRPYLAEAHVCVLPSYGEGMPRSILEALAMGRAIITTDVPGCRETVEDDGNGYLVASRDAASLATGMMRILGAPERLESAGQISRQLAEDRFDVHAVNRVILHEMGLLAEARQESVS